MNKKFTKLMAALALLTFLAIPLGMWGQTRTTQTSVIDFETGEDQSAWTISSKISVIGSFGSGTSQTLPKHGSKFANTNGNTYYSIAETKEAIENPSALTCYYTKLSGNTHTSSCFRIQVSSNGTSWQTVESGNTMNNVTQGTWYELTADLSTYTNVYVRVYYDGTSANRALDYITLTYEDGDTPSTDPEITFAPTSIPLGDIIVGNEVSATFSVSQANLTSGITLTVDNGNLSPSSISQGASATTVTWTYTPATAGAISATVTAESGTTSETLAISGTAIAPVEGYDVDFEYATNMYPNWTFSDITTQQSGGNQVTAHGGNYYGTTNGKSTASVKTAETVANPGTLTCYVTKQSGNNTSSTWYIQVSEDGSTWTDVATKDATSMSQGSWVEFTADLTDYTDVYVRVYYSGSTAIRNIDDLTLTTVEPSSAVATTTTINVPQDFNTDIYQGTTAGTLTATVKDNDDNTISGAIVTWSSSNTGVATIDANGAVTLVAVGTTTITASYAGIDDQYRPSQATYTLEVTSSAPVVDYATLPFAYDGNALAANLVPGLTQNGITDSYNTTPKIKFDTQGDYVILKINERPGILTFNIKGNSFSGGTFKVQTSEDGVTYTDLKTYTTLGDTQSEEFTNLGENVRYIKWIYTSKSSGNVALGNIKLAAYVAPELYNLTVSLSDNVSAIFVYDANNQNNPLIAGGAAGTVQVLERTSIMISPDVAQGCVLTSLMVNGENVINQLDGGAYTFTMPSQNVAISATAMVTTTYTLATTIESGRHYIITNIQNKAMGAQGTNNRSAVEISKNGNTAIVTSDDVREVVINGPDANGYYTIYDAVEQGFLYAASNSSNHLRTETHLDADKNGLWTITFDETYDNATITAKGTNSHNLMLYNTSSSLFSCYEKTSNSTGDVYLYVKNETTPQYDFYKDIAGHTTTSGWNFIASPVGTAPANMNALSDLYFYDEQDHFWRNKKIDANAAGFNFAIGNGYLAASNDDITLSFSGTSIITSATSQIPLDYSGETNPLAGWNLVGNPYPHRAYANMPYYIIDGLQLNTTARTTNDPVDFCAGIMVKATADGELVTFSKTPANNQPNQLHLTVAQQVVTRSGVNSMVNDNAIINFNEGSLLEKFIFNPDAAKLYIPQNDKEYAIVSAEAQGELPVNFKASTDGTYTLTVSPEGVEMNYLHLIDNMTGMDVDLLQTPSYTFDATTRDYESRFRLVFGANNENGTSTGAATFAYYDGSEWVVSNEGEATLQVIDMMGRIVSTETVNGNFNLNLNQNAGVYMLRLINSNGVKTQKIVVR